MKHREMNPDEAIDRLFSGLREAQPLEGMQQRVLRGARERAGARRRGLFQLPLSAAYSWAIAMAAVIAIAASWALVHSHRGASESAHAPAHLPPANAPMAETYLAWAHVPPRPANETSHVAVGNSAAPPAPVSDEDALAASEMLAPSKPAPPLPLTHQERLLAEVAHHGASEELASLRPDLRARESEIAKAEFRDFFEPTPLDTPPAKANE